MLSNSLPRSVSSVSLPLFHYQGVQGAVSLRVDSDHRGEIMVSLCRLHLESIDTRTLGVVRSVVKTERVVGGGDDVVNFCAELKIRVVFRKCPLTARVRLGIALAGLVRLLL